MEEKKDWLFFKLGSLEYDLFPSEKDLENFKTILSATGIGKDFNVAVYGPYFDVVRINVGKESEQSIGICQCKKLSWVKRIILKWLFSYKEK
jgi:hypothetical protein